MKDRNIEIWDEVSASYNDATRSLIAHQQKYKDILDIVLKKNPERILDLGIGTGTLELMLFESGYTGSIVGVEGSEKMLSISRSKLIDKKVELILADLNKKVSNIFEERFEMILLINVLFCIKDSNKFIEDIKSLLKENGTIIIVEPRPVGKLSNFIKIQFQGGPSAVLDLFMKAPSLIKTIITSNELDKDNRAKRIHFREEKEIINMLKSKGIKVINSFATQANENVLFECVV